MSGCRDCHGPCSGGRCPVPEACYNPENDIDLLGTLFVAVVCVAASLFVAMTIAWFF